MAASSWYGPGRRRAAPRSMRETARQEPHRFGLAGEPAHQHRRQPFRIVSQLAAGDGVAARGQVALVEDEVDDPQDLVEPLSPLRRLRGPVRDPGGDDLLLRSGQALGQGGFGQEEGPGDLGRGQAGHRSEGQRGLDVTVEGRMAAGEDQPETVVRLPGRRLGQGGDQRELLSVAGVAAQSVDGLAPGCRQQPGPRAVRDTFGRPPGGTPAPARNEGPLRRQRSTTGRTSTLPSGTGKLRGGWSC